MQIGVAYSEHTQQIWMNIEVPDGTTVYDAIERSGILKMFPHIDLGVQKIGIFGKVVKPETPLRVGDRVEIGDPLCVVEYNDSVKLDAAVALIRQAYRIGANSPEKTPLIRAIVTA